jgi:sporulation protein YlmC with PRC-barrel domain
MHSKILIATISILAMGACLQAENDGNQGNFTPKLTQANWIIGHSVVNDNNEEIGTCRDLVLDQNLDRVSYAAMATGGLWSIGETLHAVPWSALKVDPENKTITMSTDKKTLEDSSGFDQKNWPEYGDSRWSSSEPAARKDGEADKKMPARKGDFEYRRVTELVGLKIKNKQNENLGEIENLLIDLREGRVVYSHISFGGTLGIGEKMAVVPWSAISVRPRLDTALLDADSKMLDALALEQGKDLDLNDRQTADKLYARFNEEPYWEVFGYVVGADKKSARMMKPDAWMPGSKYNTNFDPKTIVDIECTVESVGSFKPASDAALGVRLKVMTNDKKSVTVNAGPQSYVGQSGMGFKYGDQLKVSGSRCEVDGKTVIMATKIEKGGKTLELRDLSGQPKWEAKDVK